MTKIFESFGEICDACDVHYENASIYMVDYIHFKFIKIRQIPDSSSNNIILRDKKGSETYALITNLKDLLNGKCYIFKTNMSEENVTAIYCTTDKKLLKQLEQQDG